MGAHQLEEDHFESSKSLGPEPTEEASSSNSSCRWEQYRQGLLQERRPGSGTGLMCRGETKSVPEAAPFALNSPLGAYTPDPSGTSEMISPLGPQSPLAASTRGVKSCSWAHGISSPQPLSPMSAPSPTRKLSRQKSMDAGLMGFRGARGKLRRMSTMSIVDSDMLEKSRSDVNDTKKIRADWRRRVSLRAATLVAQTAEGATSPSCRTLSLQPASPVGFLRVRSAEIPSRRKLEEFEVSGPSAPRPPSPSDRQDRLCRSHRSILPFVDMKIDVFDWYLMLFCMLSLILTAGGILFRSEGHTKAEM